MKKKLRLLLAVGMLAMLFAACGNAGGEEIPTPTMEPVSVPTSEPTATSTPTPEPTATSTPTPTPEPTATSTPTPEPTATFTPTPTPELLGNTYKKGTVTVDGFVSEWMNLRFTCQPGVTMSTQEELDEVMRQGAALMYGDSADAVLDYAALTTVTEMMAKYANGANVIIQTEQLPVLYLSLSEQEYLSILVQNLKNSAAQPEVVTGENFYTMDFGGEQYTGISLGVDYGFGQMVYQEYIVRKKESRMIVMALTYTDVSVEHAKNLLASFGAFDSEPVYLPEIAEVPTSLQPGTITETGYENEWLNMRFTLPEGVSVTDEGTADTLSISFSWTLGVPVVQILAESVTEEGETAESHLAMMKEAFQWLGDLQGLTYTFDENLYVVEIGGQEYLDLSMKAETADGEVILQEYCVRIQDGYYVAIVFSYTEGFEEELSAALDAFSQY